MLSGVGDPQELVDTTSQYPEPARVGRNLREHSAAAHMYRHDDPRYNVTEGCLHS